MVQFLPNQQHKENWNASMLQWPKICSKFFNPSNKCIAMGLDEVNACEGVKDLMLFFLGVGNITLLKKKKEGSSLLTKNIWLSKTKQKKYCRVSIFGLGPLGEWDLGPTDSLQWICREWVQELDFNEFDNGRCGC